MIATPMTWVLFYCSEVFDDKMMASNMFLFFLAGFETTASTLSYCLYELALNQQIQDKLRAEITKVKNEHDGEFTYYALKKLVYMDMCLNGNLTKLSLVLIFRLSLF